MKKYAYSEHQKIFLQSNLAVGGGDGVQGGVRQLHHEVHKAGQHVHRCQGQELLLTQVLNHQIKVSLYAMIWCSLLCLVFVKSRVCYV